MQFTGAVTVLHLPRRKGEIAAALEMGEAAGMEKGRAEGLAEGREEGRVEGRESAKLEDAAYFLGPNKKLKFLLLSLLNISTFAV